MIDDLHAAELSAIYNRAWWQRAQEVATLVLYGVSGAIVFGLGFAYAGYWT